MAYEESRKYISSLRNRVKELLEKAEDGEVNVEYLKDQCKDLKNEISNTMRSNQSLRIDHEYSAYVKPMLEKISGISTKNKPLVNVENICSYLSDVDFEIEFYWSSLNN